MKLLRVLAIATASAFLVGATAPTLVLAEMAAPRKKEAEKKETKKKELTQQQKKMKDCAGKWGQEKKAKKVSGRKAYNEFMSGCLKG